MYFFTSSPLQFKSCSFDVRLSFFLVKAAIYLDGGLNEVDRIFASVLWCDDKDVLKVWCCPPPHVLQIQEPNGDRHWLEKGDLLKVSETVTVSSSKLALLFLCLLLRCTAYLWWSQPQIARPSALQNVRLPTAYR